jgi:hypothetical protein
VTPKGGLYILCSKHLFVLYNDIKIHDYEVNNPFTPAVAYTVVEARKGYFMDSRLFL